MIIHPTTNLFDALAPQLEDHEEELFFQHPTEDIKCNQLGILYYNEDKYFYLNSKSGGVIREAHYREGDPTRKNIGSKVRVVWECYTGKVYDGGGSPHFYFLNGNPLDFRQENIFLSGDLSKKEKLQFSKIKTRFVIKSVDHLLNLEEKYEKRGVKKEDLYEQLMLPTWLINARKRAKPSPKQTRKYIGGNKSRTTQEDIDHVIKYYEMGLTYYNIMIRMSWRSTSRIKKIVKDYKLLR